MAARYWRINALELSSTASALAVAGVELCNASGVPYSGALSCNVEPALGQLANLADADPQTLCTFTPSMWQAPGFRLQWLFAEPVDVASVRFTAADSAQSFPVAFALETSADGVSWQRHWLARGLIYPGNGQSALVDKGDYSPELLRLNLHCDGAIGSTTLVDQSPRAHGFTRVGANAQIQAVSGAFEGVAMRLDGANGHFYLGNHPSLRLMGDFTLAARVWIDPASTSSFHTIMSLRGTSYTHAGWGFFVAQAGSVLLQGRSGTQSFANTAEGVVQKGVWQHIAAVRKGDQLRIFVEGVQVGAATAAQVAWGEDVWSDFCIGYQRQGAVYPFQGYIDEVLVCDEALYQETFTPPTRPYGGSVGLGPWRSPVGLQKDFLIQGRSPDLGLVVNGFLDEQKQTDVEFSGGGCIYGTVELYAQSGNIPLPRRVRLHRSRDGMLVRETWSDVQGNYRFDGITDRYKYDVIAWDHEGLQQSVVANDLTPESMQ